MSTERDSTNKNEKEIESIKGGGNMQCFLIFKEEIYWGNL